MIFMLSKTSRLKLINERALVYRGYSSFLRDFGVFKDRNTSRYEVLMSFGLCDYADIFTTIPGGKFSTDDQDYAKSLVSQFEQVWNAPELQGDFEEAERLYTDRTQGTEARSMGWKGLAARSLTEKNLQALFDNEIPAIHLGAFAAAEECQLLLDGLNGLRIENYENVSPEIGRIGITVFEAGERTESYLDRVPDYVAQMQRLFQDSFDPVQRVRDQLSKVFKGAVEIAEEPDGKRYFAGLVRVMRDGTLLHVDFAQHDAPSWCIGNVNAQITWNLFLSSGGDGGECEIYNQQWESCDEMYKSQNAYGYDRGVLKSSQSYTVKPIVGDVVFFNCRNYHEVGKTNGIRVTLGSFVGRMKDRLLLWS
jgi:hypothetical protein